MDRSGGIRHGGRVLERVAEPGATVAILGLREVGEDAWAVLADAGLEVLRLENADAALETLTQGAADVVIADARIGPPLARAVRARPDLACAHIVICAALDSPQELLEALDAGADDVMRIPFEPDVLAARVAAGLRAARLRADEALLASLVNNIPGALYRCACDSDWTMQWLSDEIEAISGYPATDFIRSSVRTFTSVIYPDDREQVEQSVMDGLRAGRPFTIEYRIVRPDGSVRWVLERGQARDAGDGRRWLDGAIFDITARRAAEEALRDRQVMEAQLAEVHASRARIVEAADRGRHDIERDLHDGAQQRLVSVALRLQLWLTAHHDLPEEDRAELTDVLDELRAGLADLRDLAQGLHPTVLTNRGLEHAINAVARRAPLPVQVSARLSGNRPPMPVETAAYFTVAEALTNVAKYADADRAWISIEQHEGHLAVEVGDDGRGGAELGAGSGLEGLRDRIAAVDGSLAIDSPPSGGTVLRAWLPV